MDHGWDVMVKWEGDWGLGRIGLEGAVYGVSTPSEKEPKMVRSIFSSTVIIHPQAHPFIQIQSKLYIYVRNGL